ncbi:MAG: MFS transporter, partial [Nocardioidaceae bacterium]
VWGNLASTLTVAPLLLVDQADDLWILYAAAFGYGMSFVMLPAAMNGMLKLILADDALVDGNAAIGTTKEALRIAGPIAGAGIYAVAGPHLVVAVNIVAYVVAAAIIARLRVTGDEVDRARMSTRGSLLVGLRHVRNDPLLMHPLVGVGLALVVFGFTESAAYALIDDYGKPAAYVGVLVTVQGVGAVLGGVLASPLIKRIGEPYAILLSLALFVVGTTGTAVAPAIGFVLAAVIPIGFGLPLMIIALMTLLQRRTPAAIIARVSTAFDVVLGTPRPCPSRSARCW